MDKEKLLKLIEDDDLGLLDVKPKQANGMTEDERLAESFFEITTFYREHGREPENDMANVQESRLAMRLSNLRKDPGKISVIEESIELIISGEIVNFTYDDESKLICNRQ